MKALAGIACALFVLGMGAVGVYQMGQSRGHEAGYHEGHEAGIMVGGCRVVTAWRPDLDWSKECGSMAPATTSTWTGTVTMVCPQGRACYPGEPRGFTPWRAK